MPYYFIKIEFDFNNNKVNYFFDIATLKSFWLTTRNYTYITQVGWNNIYLKVDDFFRLKTKQFTNKADLFLETFFN